MDKIMDFDGFSLYKEFEKLVQTIFESNGFKTEIPSIDKGYDFLTTIDNTIAYVEVKFYTSKLPKIDLLRQAYRRLLSQQDNENAKLILVISSYVTTSLKEEIFKESGVIIWDAKTLFALAFDFSTIYHELENILIRAFNGQLDDLTIVDANYKSTIIPSLKNALTNVKQKKTDGNGEKLCKELNALNPGRPDAANFEDKCKEILKYLFDNNTDLTLWELQPTIDDNLHQFDFLCRNISSSSNAIIFLSLLLQDYFLIEKYVVFKSHNINTSKIKWEIYKTTINLFVNTLSSFNFKIPVIISEYDAIKASKEAFEEEGKLIVFLTAKDICEMLKLKDKGDEPSIILKAKIDEMLIKLTR